MTETHPELSTEAATWFVRLTQSDASEADWVAHRDWLEQSAGHAQAFAQVEAAWVTLEDHIAVDEGRIVRLRARAVRPKPYRRWVLAGVGAAAAAVFALVIAPQQGVVTYTSPLNTTRTVDLKDGSHLVLNRGAELRLRLDRSHRTVDLVRGEASFDVAHDAARPFVIAAGDREIRVVGTQFNVLRYHGRLTVTVNRGRVAVQGTERSPAETISLGVGDQLIHQEGSAVTQTARVDPQDASGWQRGVLIYRDRPLAEVSADLGRYLPHPISVDAGAKGLRFTGVLFIDSEDAMMRRLEAFLPVTAERTSTEIRLKAREHS